MTSAELPSRMNRSMITGMTIPATVSSLSSNTIVDSSFPSSNFFTTLEGHLFYFKCSHESHQINQLICSESPRPRGQSFLSSSLGKTNSEFLAGDSSGSLLMCKIRDSGEIHEMVANSVNNSPITHISCSLRNRNVCAVTNFDGITKCYDSHNMKCIIKLPGKSFHNSIGLGDTCVLSSCASSGVHIFDLRQTKCAVLKFNVFDSATCMAEPFFDCDGSYVSNFIAFGSLGGRCFILRAADTKVTSGDEISHCCYVPFRDKSRSDITHLVNLSENLLACGNSKGKYTIINATTGRCTLSDSEPGALTSLSRTITFCGMENFSRPTALSCFSSATGHSSLRYYST